MIHYTPCCGLTVAVKGADPGELLPFAWCPRCGMPLFEDGSEAVRLDGTEERFRHLEID